MIKFSIFFLFFIISFTIANNINNKNEEFHSNHIQEIILNAKKRSSNALKKEKDRNIENRGFKFEIPFEETNDLYEYAQINSNFTFNAFNQLDENDMSPLMVAASVGNYEAVRNYLLAGANPSFSNLQGMNALHYAVKGGFYNTMIELLNPPSISSSNSTSSSSRLSVIQKNNFGISPLLLAVEMNYFILVEYMIRHDKALFDQLITKISTQIKQLENDLENLRLNHENISYKPSSSSSSSNILSPDSIHFNPNKKSDGSVSSPSSTTIIKNDSELYLKGKQSIIDSIKIYENQLNFITSKSLLRQKKVINEHLADGTTLLMISSQMGTTRMSSLLVEYGAFIKGENSYLDSALSMLSTSSSFELLIKTNGLNPMIKNEKKQDQKEEALTESEKEKVSAPISTYIHLMKYDHFFFPLHLFNKKRKFEVHCNSHNFLLNSFYSSLIEQLQEEHQHEIFEQLPSTLSSFLHVNYFNSIGLICTKFSEKESGAFIQFTSPIHILLDFPNHKYNLRLPSAATSSSTISSTFSSSLSSMNQTSSNSFVFTSLSNSTYTYLPLLLSVSRKNIFTFFTLLRNIPKSDRKSALLYTPPSNSNLSSIPGAGLSVKDYLVETYKTNSEIRRKKLKQESFEMSSERFQKDFDELMQSFPLFSQRNQKELLGNFRMNFENDLIADVAELMLLMVVEIGVPVQDKFQRYLTNKLKNYSFFE